LQEKKRIEIIKAAMGWVGKNIEENYGIYMGESGITFNSIQILFIPIMPDLFTLLYSDLPLHTV